MINIIPYLRNKISISLVLSPVILLLLLTTTTTSPVLQLFNLLLLQPVQAADSITARMHTLEPADGTVCPSSTAAQIGFDAGGTYSPPDRVFTNVAGSFQIFSDGGGGSSSILYSGGINGADFILNTSGWLLELHGTLDNYNSSCVPTGSNQIQIVTPCGNPPNPITVILENKQHLGDFSGYVSCDPQPPPSSSSSPSMAAGTTTTQDGDGDGVPDANDRCPHTPHTRCYIEGTQSMAGNQTR